MGASTTKFTSCGNSENMRNQFNALRADVTAIRSALVATHAKLDADAGVTDTDYNGGDPAALTSADLTAY